MRGAPLQRWHSDESVRQVGGILIADSRGIFDALTRTESPQLRSRSARTGEEARGIMEQCSVSLSLSEARKHWVKPRYPARAGLESFLSKKRWRLSSLEDVDRREEALFFTDDVPENHDSIEDPVEFSAR